MKKLILGSLIVSSIMFSSCGKDDDVSNRSCETLEQNAVDALSDFSNNATEENCKLYKSILQAQLANGCTEGDEGFTQRIFNSLNCNPF